MKKFASSRRSCLPKKTFASPKKQCVTSDNSQYSIVKDLLLLLSTGSRNFNIQMGAYDVIASHPVATVECSSFNPPASF
jgi:hypothetical protein